MIIHRGVLLIFVASIVMALMASGRAMPTAGKGYEPDPEETGGMFEGDMVLTDAQERVLQRDQPQGRNGMVDVTKRWPNRRVYYKILGDFDAKHRAAILEGMQMIESVSCVTFEEADDAKTEYVAILSKPDGCYTAVGYLAKVQEMNLAIYPIGEGCFRPGTILHELMHALGFYHQQSSAIRDDFIDVINENIIPGKEFNFKKFSESLVTDFGVGYDYASCLHYGPRAFSSSGEDTIVPKDRSAIIGQRIELSPKDIDKINIMYKCPILV